MVKLEITKKEIINLLEENKNLYIETNMSFNDQKRLEVENFLNNNEHFLFYYEIENDSIILSKIVNYPDSISNKKFLLELKEDKIKVSNSSNVGSGNNNCINIYSFNKFRSTIYYFDPERYKVGLSKIGTNHILNSNADNLPEVLTNLLSNPKRFDKYNEMVKSIFPEIQQITIENRNNNVVEIMIWTINPSTERKDLALPLNKCGSGIGQILLIINN